MLKKHISERVANADRSVFGSGKTGASKVDTNTNIFAQFSTNGTSFIDKTRDMEEAKKAVTKPLIDWTTKNITNPVRKFFGLEPVKTSSSNSPSTTSPSSKSSHGVDIPDEVKDDNEVQGAEQEYENYRKEFENADNEIKGYDTKIGEKEQQLAELEKQSAPQKDKEKFVERSFRKYRGHLTSFFIIFLVCILYYKNKTFWLFISLLKYLFQQYVHAIKMNVD